MLAAAWLWEPGEGPPPLEALRDVDAVVNLAGESLQGRWTPAKKERILDSRIVGTRYLVQGMASETPRPAVLVSASASGVYGDRGDDLLTEDAAPGKGFLAEVCVEWEREASKARDLGGGCGWCCCGLGSSLAPMAAR